MLRLFVEYFGNVELEIDAFADTVVACRAMTATDAPELLPASLPAPEPLRLEPCDIVTIRGSNFLSRAILRLTAGRVSHVGLVVAPGTLSSAIVQEAVYRVRRGTLAHYYGGSPNLVGVFRPISLTPEDRELILAAAVHSVGLPYGYGKILLCLADSLLPHRPYYFRRFGASKYPICSGDVARCFEVAGLSFGVEAGQATPADIDYFCRTRPDHYVPIRELLPIPTPAT